MRGARWCRRGVASCSEVWPRLHHQPFTEPMRKHCDALLFANQPTHALCLFLSSLSSAASRSPKGPHSGFELGPERSQQGGHPCAIASVMRVRTLVTEIEAALYNATHKQSDTKVEANYLSSGRDIMYRLLASA